MIVEREPEEQQGRSDGHREQGPVRRADPLVAPVLALPGGGAHELGELPKLDLERLELTVELGQLRDRRGAIAERQLRERPGQLTVAVGAGPGSRRGGCAASAPPALRGEDERGEAEHPDPPGDEDEPRADRGRRRSRCGPARPRSACGSWRAPSPRRRARAARAGPAARRRSARATVRRPPRGGPRRPRPPRRPRRSGRACAGRSRRRGARRRRASRRSASARNARRAAFASPSTGGAASWILSRPSCSPTTRVRDARGWTSTSSTAPPAPSRAHAVTASPRAARSSPGPPSRSSARGP